MNREDYRAAVDDVSFSPDFQEKTVALLLSAQGQNNEKEHGTMKTVKMRRSMILVAAVVAMLVVSASAVVLLLSPRDVAERIDDPLLAEAFESEGAVLLEETVTTGDYDITLAGMVSGDGLSAFPVEVNGGIQPARTYVVLSLKRTDGAALTELPNLTYTPLVATFPVNQVNAWTLGSGCQSFLEEGVAYFLFDTKNLEIFADHTVYLAIYEGFAPSAETFAMAEDGSITMTDALTGPRALFALPLDPSTADPSAVEQFMADYAAAFFAS